MPKGVVSFDRPCEIVIAKELSRAASQVEDENLGVCAMNKKLIFGCVLIYLAVAWWSGIFVDALIWNTTVQYDRQGFHDSFAKSDKVVIRQGGYFCCIPATGPALLILTNQVEVNELLAHLQFRAVSTTNSMLEACMCCGFPSLDWYQGSNLLAITSIQHMNKIRWGGFSTSRSVFGRVGYGDAPMTEASRIWLTNWFQRHNLPMSEFLENGETKSAVLSPSSKQSEVVLRSQPVLAARWEEAESMTFEIINKGRFPIHCPDSWSVLFEDGMSEELSMPGAGNLQIQPGKVGTIVIQRPASERRWRLVASYYVEDYLFDVKVKIDQSSFKNNIPDSLRSVRGQNMQSEWIPGIRVKAARGIP